ncbi:tyrosine-type recombinase/integrase [Ktedonobacter racemifer]|uniref:tyrosine-type recombinase/integrase n=1 Tax=Ktedonobacter racemifer TaxID=363277 RepID=UPI0012FC48BB|nr:site-specific integrase [Ktedonobacter racemifer]
MTETPRFSPKWETQFGACLARLLHPLDEVLTITGASKSNRNGTVIILLREMHRLQTSFWAWSEQEWIGVLHPRAAIFAKHHGGADAYRSHLLAASYLLGGLSDLAAIGHFTQDWLAVRVFGRDILDLLVEHVGGEMIRLGFGKKMVDVHLHNLLYEVLLMNRSPRLEDLSFEVLTEIRPKLTSTHLKSYIVSFTHALVSLDYLEKPITVSQQGGNLDTLAGVPGEWLKYCERWRKTSTLAKSSRKGYYWCLIKAGRWLAQYHPEVVSPGQWTRELAAEYVAAVMNFGIGDWTHRNDGQDESENTPLSAKTKVQHLKAVSSFIRDCQEWNWIPRHFDPRRAFTTPRSIQSLLGPNPRAIDDEIWAKLMWAGLNLTEEDLPVFGSQRTHYLRCYPFELVRACTLVWLFTGLRADEICRLRVGCIRWQKEDLVVTGTDDVVPKEVICWLNVPVNKTGSAFTKPVDRIVGEAIDTWEQVRPTHRKEVDHKSGEMVEYLFSFKGRRISMDYLNHTVIPMLCQKAGVPQEDSRGAITSHRARSTIATQLFNAKEPMSLFELQEWLGHRYASSTQHYAKVKLTKLAKSFTQAGYFERNIRVVEVLLDQEAVKSGAAAAGEPWRFYDLGHGYCSYDFFDQCPHRMACAKCTFYVPKESSQAQILEGKANLQRMLQEIPLSDDEREAVEEGIEALEKLSAQLVDIPTPAGPTPRQLQENSGKSSFVSLQSVQRRFSQA